MAIITIFISHTSKNSSAPIMIPLKSDGLYTNFSKLFFTARKVKKIQEKYIIINSIINDKSLMTQVERHIGKHSPILGVTNDQERADSSA